MTLGALTDGAAPPWARVLGALLVLPVLLPLASPLNFRRIRLYFSSDIEGVFYSKVRVKFLSLENFDGRILN